MNIDVNLKKWKYKKLITNAEKSLYIAFSIVLLLANDSNTQQGWRDNLQANRTINF